MEPKIYKTTDYKMFKKITGNRPVYKNHVKALIDSISEEAK
jgi:hypothetical protein